VTVQLFFNPDLVGQLAACGITTRRREPSGEPAAGFVLEGRRNPRRPREVVTNVIAVRGPVTITGTRALGAGSALPTAAGTANTAQTALELVEENVRLRRDNQRLSNEIDQLRVEVARLAKAPNDPLVQPREQNLDDAAARFALLELD
jgi:hypothetical protein